MPANDALMLGIAALMTGAIGMLAIRRLRLRRRDALDFENQTAQRGALACTLEARLEALFRLVAAAGFLLSFVALLKI